MIEDVWLASHPYLRPIAQLHLELDAALAAAPLPEASVPEWGNYSEDYDAGVPLLRSAKVTVDFSPADRVIAQVVRDLASRHLPGQLAQESKALDADLHSARGAPRVSAWLLDGEEFTPTHPGLLRYLGWTLLARFLSPVVAAFSRWREEQRWLRRYCPTCGAPPAMAQLIGKDPGRLRFLCCGCCGTRWRFGRTRCPFCDEADHHRLAVIAVEGEQGLRIDYCEACGG